MSDNISWKILSRFVEIRSKWLTLIGEKIENNNQEILEYWRVKKDDSAVIIVIHNNQFLLPIPSYRPGLGEITLDFAGGRIPENKTPIEVIPTILKRELDIDEFSIASLTSLNKNGWAINSSFSNQKLYGFVVSILPNTPINSDKLGLTYPVTQSGVNQLLQDLNCLQCRAILLEWKNSLI
ncbi:MAG TPA: NUDIX hydrolase [Cyanothece sp. UBA12306]|nr:NUDIX hydrolase [Cyanothece sp. UBA12306]